MQNHALARNREHPSCRCLCILSVCTVGYCANPLVRAQHITGTLLGRHRQGISAETERTMQVCGPAAGRGTGAGARGRRRRRAAGGRRASERGRRRGGACRGQGGYGANAHQCRVRQVRSRLSTPTCLRLPDQRVSGSEGNSLLIS